MNELNGYKASDCVHAIDLYENEIKEVCCYCDECGHRNITLGDCFGNCDLQESDRKKVGKTNELKPCPFCGERAELHKNVFSKTYSVECKRCTAKVTGCETSVKAFEMWNRRTK